MFLSAQALAIEYGIDERIAKFFVDREPPKDNLYWKDKLLYLRPQPGYIFIPLIIDLYQRLKLPLETLLDEGYVGTLEQVLHLAAEEEYGMISHAEAEKRCRSIFAMNGCSQNFFKELTNYFDYKPCAIKEFAGPFKALHRGDLFLYSLCVLDVPEEKFNELVKAWFALISVLLLMDDSEDYETDKAVGDANAFLESGSSKEGFDEIKMLLADCLNKIAALNYSMAHALHKKAAALGEKPGIKEYLNK